MAMSYNPLTDAHCEICDKILQTIDEPIAIARACIGCGFPAEDLLQQLEQIKHTAEQVKRTFFPGKP
jgi:Zn ribbon nucleic-acid-binding protein